MESEKRSQEQSDATVAEVTGDAPTPRPPSAASAGQYFLIVTGAEKPSLLGFVLPLAGETCVIGRGRGADLRLEDTGLSRQHARVILEAGGRHAVEDLGSTNGTYVNGVRIQRAVLGEGDRIQMGRATSLRYSGRARLQPREEQVRRALAASGVGTWEWLADHERLVLSEDSERVLGVGKEAALDPLTLVKEEDRERVLHAFRLALHTGVCEVDCRCTAPGGGVRWVSLRGERFQDEGGTLRLAGALFDVTAQHEATESLRRQALIFGAISDGLVVMDGGGLIVDWNPGAERLFGVPRDEAVGRAPEELQGLGWREEVTKEILGATSRDAGWRAELELGRRSGGESSVEMAAFPLHDGHGVHFASVVVCRDVGERRRIEAHLQIADRQASLWRIAAGLAHQINNPLAALGANLRWVSAAFGDLGVTSPAGQEIGEVLEEMVPSLQRIRTVVSDLGTLSGRAQAGEVRPLDINRIIDLVVRITDGELRARAALRLRLAEVPPVLASEAGMAQAVQDVLAEALHRFDPGPAGGNEVEIATGAEGREVVVTVTDNARALSAHDLAHVFDPFYRVEVDRPRASLALSVALSLVQGAGGTITVSSEGGHNAFRIALPALPQAAGP